MTADYIRALNGVGFDWGTRKLIYSHLGRTISTIA
jgi:hypothetical protein